MQEIRVPFTPDEHSSKEGAIDYKSKWDKCLRWINQELPWQTIQTWFIPIIPVSFNDNLLILRVPSSFFFEWLESHYGQLLLKAVSKFFGSRATIEYLVASTSQTSAEPISENNEIVLEEVKSEKLDTGINIDAELNSKFTLKNFFTSNENLMVKRAAEYVSQSQKEKLYNPLFLQGDVGTGKTHILNAIGNAISEKSPHYKICLISSQQFIHEYVFTLQKGKVNNFKHFFVSSDVFLLDDVHFFSNKTGSQDILFFIVSQLLKKGKQVVITSKEIPKNLKQFNSNLISFLQSGLILNFQYASHSTKEQFTNHYIKKHNLTISSEIKEYIMDRASDSMQILQALMIRIVAQSSLLHKPLCMEDIRAIISHINPEGNGFENRAPKLSKITVDIIIKAVSEYFKIPADMICGNSRNSSVVQSRQIAMYVSRRLTNDSLSGIGYHFGDKHHASVLYAFKKIKMLKAANPILKKSIEEIIDSILKG
jgi:chromosomal replication initiator protein